MRNAKYRVDTIANYVIKYSNKHNLDVSNLKLQKILPRIIKLFYRKKLEFFACL